MWLWQQIAEYSFLLGSWSLVVRQKWYDLIWLAILLLFGPLTLCRKQFSWLWSSSVTILLAFFISHKTPCFFKSVTILLSLFTVHNMTYFPQPNPWSKSPVPYAGDSHVYLHLHFLQMKVMDNKLFEITPQKGRLPPGATQVVTFTYNHTMAGTDRLPVLFKLSCGREILVTWPETGFLNTYKLRVAICYISIKNLWILMPFFFKKYASETWQGCSHITNRHFRCTVIWNDKHAPNNW